MNDGRPNVQTRPDRPGHFIREWRKHRCLTQDQLAEQIGIARSYLSKIESGARRYDQPFLEAAAPVLGCEPGDLIARDPGAAEDIRTIWKRLTPTQRGEARAVLEALFDSGLEQPEAAAYLNPL